MGNILSNDRPQRLIPARPSSRRIRNNNPRATSRSYNLERRRSASLMRSTLIKQSYLDKGANPEQLIKIAEAMIRREADHLQRNSVHRTLFGTGYLVHGVKEDNRLIMALEHDLNGLEEAQICLFELYKLGKALVDEDYKLIDYHQALLRFKKCKLSQLTDDDVDDWCHEKIEIMDKFLASAWHHHHLAKHLMSRKANGINNLENYLRIARQKSLYFQGAAETIKYLNEAFQYN